MPSVDTGYGVYGPVPYVDPILSPTNGMPNAGATTAPGSLFTPAPAATAGVVSSVPNAQQFQDMINNSPDMKQALQYQDQAAALALEQMALNKDAAAQLFQMNMAQASGGGGSYGAGLAEAAAADKLRKEQAAHDLKNQQEYVREALGSRGLSSSGQLPLEQSELKYAYDMLVKQIDLAAQARQAQSAQAAANSARASSNNIAELQLRYNLQMRQLTIDEKSLAIDIAQKRGEAVNSVRSYLTDLWFDPKTETYRGPNGATYTTAQAQSSLPAATYVNPTYSPAVDAPGVNPIMYFK